MLSTTCLARDGEPLLLCSCCSAWTASRLYSVSVGASGRRSAKSCPFLWSVWTAHRHCTVPPFTFRLVSKAFDTLLVGGSVEEGCMQGISSILHGCLYKTYRFGFEDNGEGAPSRRLTVCFFQHFGARVLASMGQLEHSLRHWPFEAF